MTRRSAIVAAQELLDRFGVDAPEDIRLEAMAWRLKVAVVDGALEGSAARLAVHNGRGRVRIPAGEHSGRRRFSIAHELGHLCLHRHELQACSEADFNDWHSDSSKESEANAFAAELLLPTSLLHRRCEADVNFAAVREIARDFDVSLTAASVRFVELSPEPCALALSEAGAIKWILRSAAFWPYTVARGTQLDSRSLAYDVFSGARSVAEDPEEVDAEAWLDDYRIPSGTELVEHVASFRAYNVALSLLWLRGLEEPD